ncbi:MAG: hypothetical protein AAGD32_15390 [Planctomycetota bacterium]
MQRKIAIAIAALALSTATHLTTNAATIDSRLSSVGSNINGSVQTDGSTSTASGSLSFPTSAISAASPAFSAAADQDTTLNNGSPLGFFVSSTASTSLAVVNAPTDAPFVGQTVSQLRIDFTVGDGFVGNFVLAGSADFASDLEPASNGVRVFLTDAGGNVVTPIEDLSAASGDGVPSPVTRSGSLAAGSYTVGYDIFLNSDGVIGTDGSGLAEASLSFTITSTPIPSPTAVLGGGALLVALPLRRQRAGH